MSYTVVWSPRAEASLAKICLDPKLSKVAARCSWEIDRRLQLKGPEAGESRHSNYRIDFEPPLAVLFRVDESAKMVFVIYCWAFVT
jgi:hypothetical protein